MPDEYVTLAEHREFAKRIEDENGRQNHRLAKLEDAVQNIAKLTISVEKLAVSIDRMTAEQKEVSSRLSALEQEPAENWKKAVWIVITALIGGAVGYFLH